MYIFSSTVVGKIDQVWECVYTSAVIINIHASIHTHTHMHVYKYMLHICENTHTYIDTQYSDKRTSVCVLTYYVQGTHIHIITYTPQNLAHM